MRNSRWTRMITLVFLSAAVGLTGCMTTISNRDTGETLNGALPTPLHPERPLTVRAARAHWVTPAYTHSPGMVLDVKTGQRRMGTVTTYTGSKAGANDFSVELKRMLQEAGFAEVGTAGRTDGYDIYVSMAADGAPWWAFPAILWDGLMILPSFVAPVPIVEPTDLRVEVTVVDPAGQEVVREVVPMTRTYVGFSLWGFFAGAGDTEARDRSCAHVVVDLLNDAEGTIAALEAKRRAARGEDLAAR